MRHALSLGLILALCAGTALAQPPTVSRGTDYFPVAKGTKWTYKVGDNSVEVRVAKIEKVNNEDQYLFETIVGKDAKTTEMLVVRADGVYRTKVKDDKIDPPIKILPLPPKAGIRWMVDSKVGAQTLKGELEIKSTRERVNVPAGEFDAVLVEGAGLNIAGATTTIRIWFARGYGIVKEEFVLSAGDKVVLELLKFEPGESPAPPVSPPAPLPPTAEVVLLPACSFPQPCRILPPRCLFRPITTQESCGCCARSVRCWVRRR